MVKLRKSHLRSNARAPAPGDRRDPVILSSAIRLAFAPAAASAGKLRVHRGNRLEEKTMPQSSFVFDAVPARLRPRRSRPRWPAPGRRARARRPPARRRRAQKLDADYTAKIKAATADPRILTELVDHMPASDKVPSPLKFLGYIPGEPGKHDLPQGHRPLPRGARQGVRPRDDVQDRRERRRARHGRAWRSPTKRRSSSSTSTGRSPRSSPIRAS